MIGTTIAHYRVEAELGRGGMGVVYRAQDETLGRDVALKVLPAEAVADAPARERLIREARTASQLNHPHICTIFEAGEAHGQVYVAMELVSGRTLAAEIPPEGLAAEAVVRYASQIADALAHAHTQGVVHRDLKPANVMITREGRAKVLDFGLARRLPREELSAVTRSQLSAGEAGGVAGTLAYMAPEQLRGEPADARSDIWALGVVLHEMATGRRPFSAPSGYGLSAQILREPLPTLPQQIRPGLALVIQRCLAKEPGQRYQSASEVRAALDVAASGPVPQVAAGTHWPSRLNWVIGVALVAAAALALVAFDVAGLRSRLLGSRAPRIESLAVLPLENLTGDSAQEYFADGMTEALISELAQIHQLRVISRTSVMRYKGARKSLPEIAKELKVDAVVEGSVQRSGDKVGITVQLIHAPTDRHLWSKPYERDLRDVLSLQREVARAIASEIRLQLTPQEEARLASAPSVDPAAHEAYLKGRYFSNKGITREALQNFQQAINAYPDYAEAYAGMANSMVFATPATEFMPRARAAALKALELNPNLPDAHSALGMVKLMYEWDWQGAEREFLRALELDSNNAETRLRYSNYLAAMGRLDEAVAEASRAQQLDPLSSLIGQQIGRCYHFQRQPDRAIEQYKKTLQIDPDARWSHAFLSFEYEDAGQYELWLAHQRRSWFLFSGNTERGDRMERAFRAGGYRAALGELIADYEEEAQRGRMASATLAINYAKSGNKEKALYWLEKAYQSHTRDLIYLNVEPNYDSIRSDPRFQEIVRKIGLPKPRP